MNFYSSKGAWKVTPWLDGPSSYTNHPPCWFHRFMVRWCFGVRWTKEPE